ncbi:CarboxypepD_reg-like domain-containing protein [Reichenbachiella faecimaris]|uniref:CarboxypepD_reg-like domain-containing protein n=1 Tax=Reichenbachiella faecimaris TaxID=692418 RepID=A0A1W2G740_REIFA|nr:carboxypeptidase-like regulatory domain-containing protein [Reichenbachiella faecimaris]SMD32411.1 CarboxypepD_reg-like domain-containing protein [Reichenbachiella faecimaris]
MKLKIFIYLFCFLFASRAWSQTDGYISISSKILNEEGEPISFAHLLVKGKNLGGITNQDGFFSYKIPEEYLEDTLVVSSIGLASLELPIKELTASKTPEYIMVEQAIELEGITIYAPAKLLQKAFESFSSQVPQTSYYKCSGVYTITSEENETYTLFEQLVFDVYYRGEQDDPGMDILAHRRSIDYSMFPVLYSQKSQSHMFSVSGEILGLPVFKRINSKQDKLDGLELKITDILELDGQQVYVITEFAKGADNFIHEYYRYYITEESNRLIKVSEILADFSLRPNERMTNSGKYNNDLIETRHSYWLAEVNGQMRITEGERVFKWLNVERLTGNLLKVHKETAHTQLYDFEDLDVQPQKFPSRLKLPDDTPYDEPFWNAWDSKRDFKFDERVQRDLTAYLSLKSQFAQTNGLIKLTQSMREETFNKKDQRKQTEVSNTEQFIEDLLSNNYNSGFAPDLGWEDIPALMEIVNSNEILTNFPRNILGRYYVDQCQAGIVAMWLIDSIRKNEGKKPRKAWYISPFPILQSEVDTRQISEFMSQGNRANVMIKNTEEKLNQAHESFVSWWTIAQQMNPNKAKRINPLADSDLKWMGL